MNLQAQRDLSIAGDAVGHDKIGRDKIEGDQINIYHYGEKKERPIPRMAPPAPRVFVGRDEVLRELIVALKLGEDGTDPIALTALKGMGGIGKTTLAAALANHHEVETALPDGTLWAGLGPEPEVMSLLAEWGTQLGEDFAQLDSPEARSRRLSTLLHDKKALLVVDDVWQAEAARHFLVGGPRCRALITTRDNEIARKLAGHAAIQIETLANAASINLLHKFAADAVASDEKAANELATALDGLPLALTLAGQLLAAKWGAGFGIAGALSRLKDREARLKLDGAETRPGLATAKPSLGAILAMSYESLPEEATKRAFRLLGVFGGRPLAFLFEAAAAIWEMEPFTAEDTMVALVDRALVESLGDERYTLHTILADFAESLLKEGGEAVLACETHANYYLEFARNNAEKNWQAVEMEMGQIRSGFEWVSSRLTDKQKVLDYEQALRSFFNRRGLWNDKIRWAQIGLEVAHAKGERECEALLLNGIGYSHYRRNAWDTALVYYERSRTIQEEIGDQTELVQSFINIGRIYRQKGDWAEALKYYERSRRLSDEIGDRVGLAQSLLDIGVIYTYKNLWDEALGYFEHSRMIFEETGNQAELAVAFVNVGIVFYNKGLWDKALEYYENCQRILEEIGDRVRLAGPLVNIGLVYYKKGLWDKALEYCKRSLAIREETGDRRGVATALMNLGDIYEKQMRLVEAEQVLSQAVAIFEEVGSRFLENARKQLDKVRELQRSAL